MVGRDGRRRDAPDGRRPRGARPARPNGHPNGTTGPAADLVVATGGAWAVAPAPAVALALVDVLRRPGAGQYALDHARILAPLGSIPDADERRAMIADLVDDLLAPLGTFVTPAGMRPGRSAGSLVVHGRPAARPSST